MIQFLGNGGEARTPLAERREQAEEHDGVECDQGDRDK
jgi:hypothetical protein